MRTDLLEKLLNDDDMPPAFSLAENAFGKCLAELTFRCPPDLRRDFVLHAAKHGQTAAWRQRFWMALDAWGIDHVTSLIASSFPVAGPEADAYAKAVVGAMVGSLLQSTKSEVAAAPARRATDRATR